MPWVTHASVRNTDWRLFKDEDNKFSHERVRQALLMDIREELRALNRVFACPNFQAVPHTLNRIAQHTKPKPKARKRTVKR